MKASIITMKEKVEAKRTILCGLADMPECTADEILTGEFEGKELKYVIALLDELKKDGYVDDYASKEKAKLVYSLSRRGDDRAEYLSCQERWEKTMNICSKLHDFSENTVNRVFDQLLSKDVSEMVGNPVADLVDEISRLNSSLDLMRLTR